MKARLALRFAALVSLLLSVGEAAAEGPDDLRLVPYPKQVQRLEGDFALDRPLLLEAPPELLEVVSRLLGEELTTAGLAAPQSRPGEPAVQRIRLVAAAESLAPETPAVEFRPEATPEDYTLHVAPQAVTIQAPPRSGKEGQQAGAAGGTLQPPQTSGLLHGVATLRQLIRANRSGTSLPCLAISDWPALRWRAYQDDITRGPSTRLAQLKRDVARGGLLKMNVFTYYMQHQFAFEKHPLIGPPDGSLTPAELQELVAFARPLGVHILGNQQSFAHMQHTLRLPQYAHLREDDRTLTPTKEKTYQLLDDLYSEVLPLLELPYFNVCCDETWGLGTRGPAKELADQIGPGGVYVRHIRRVHDLVQGRYGKRMMMWGDIILNHPDQLPQIPRDVIMLTWGYDPRESFTDQIEPFAESGYEFVVCPGVNNWSRVLPDYRRAVVNIQNFVRDGAQHGTLGMLNTSWDDDGENLNAPNWYGFAWGAECAWNASATPREDFDRRIGAVLFGEAGDHFGQALQRLSDPRLSGMSNREFWAEDSPAVRASDRAVSLEALQLAGQAREHLEACRRQARVDADLLEAMEFGVRRLIYWHQQRIARIGAAGAYRQVADGQAADPQQALERIVAATAEARDELAGMREQWSRLWLAESKPHALDWSLARYDRRLEQLSGNLQGLQAAQRALAAGEPLPPPAEVGLQLWERPEQLTHQARIESSLEPYRDYFREFALDGDPQSFFWSNRGLEPGDHLTVRLPTAPRLAAVKLRLGTDRYQQEFVHGGLLEYSIDGETWETLGTLNAREQRFELPDEPIRAIRLRAQQPQRFWLIVREIELQPRGETP